MLPRSGQSAVFPTYHPLNGAVTSTDRRTALRTGAGLLAAGALTAGCATSGAVAHPTTSAHPSTDPATAPAAPTPRGYPGSPPSSPTAPAPAPGSPSPSTARATPRSPTPCSTAAEKHDARLTVLAVGTWLDEHPDVARRILDGGHDLGNHTQRHLDSTPCPRPTRRTPRSPPAPTGSARLTGSIGTWFRPSRSPARDPAGRSVWPAAPATRTSSRTTSTPSTTPRPAPTPSPRTVLGEVRAGSVGEPALRLRRTRSPRSPSSWKNSPTAAWPP